MLASLIRVAASEGFFRVAVALGCLLIVALGVHWQSLVHINHDVGWIAHSAGWLLDGKRFGTDILDPNPPMAWFLMLPAVAAARAGILPELAAIQTWSWFLSCAGMALSAAILLPMARTLGRIEVAGLLLAIVGAAAYLPIGNFGQRDIIAFVLILPYLFALMCRLGAGPVPERGLLILAGLGAGIGFCLKPFLLAVPLLTEPLRLLLTRNFRAVIRAETVAMGVAVGLYAISILVFAGGYLDFALPLIRSVYWAYDDQGAHVLSRFLDAVMPAAYAIGIAAVTLSFNRLHAVMIAAIAGFSISYWVQGKGFPYHVYPVLGASCVSLAYSVIHGIRSAFRNAFLGRLPALRWVVAVLILFVATPVMREPFWQAREWYRTADRERGDRGRSRDAVIARLRSLGVGPTDYLYAFSTHPYPGFPTVNYLGARWTGRAVTQFAIPAVVRKSEVTDPAILREIDRAEARQIEIVVDDLTTHRPKYVMLEARQRRLGLEYRPFDDIAYYSRSPEFVRLWACYVEIDPAERIRLFRRRAECRPG